MDAAYTRTFTVNQSKSEILWLGSLRQRKDSILKLKLSDEKVQYMPWVFIFNEELATKRNFFEKLPKLKKILNIWSSRDISTVLCKSNSAKFANIQT